MRVAVTRSRGAARDVITIEDRPSPEPGAGEVRVQVMSSGVNPSDVKVRAGAQGPLPADEVMVHNDGAGIIDAVGDGVSERRIGEHVWLFNINRSEDGMAQGANGTAADQIICSEDLAAPLPHGVSFDEGACLGVPAMTAHRAVFADGPVDGRIVLVTGGAGSVGLLAVQMASAAGATVIATVSNDAKSALARAAGAALVINYRTEDLAARIVEEFGANSVDRLVDVDFGVHVSLTPQILKRNGVIATYASMGAPEPSLPFYQAMFNNTTIRLVFVYAMPDDAKWAAIEDINAFLRDGALAPLVAATYPFEQIAEAHEAVEAGGLTGNVVLQIAAG
ncbi:NADPH:quinone reductase [Coralliovum pocilloporae]|uniref:NADPH:quinone reductase n=1 Tax=Coralliovum pocilloporae TaxID=3066369 RepID=UPI0033079383